MCKMPKKLYASENCSRHMNEALKSSENASVCLRKKGARRRTWDQCMNDRVL